MSDISKAARALVSQRWDAAPVLTKVCVTCGTNFSTKAKTRLYCSKPCQWKVWNDTARGKRAKGGTE